MSNNFVFIGDVMLGENLYHYGRGIRTKYSNRYNELINREVLDKLTLDTEFIFYNFEYSLVSKDFSYNRVTDSVYRSDIDTLKLFPEYSIKIVNIANNHFSQHGKSSASYTKQMLIKNKFLIVGEDNNCLEIQNIDKKIKIWASSLVRDKFFCDEYFYSDYTELLNNLDLPEKQKSEFWIISLHWGDEYIHKPSHDQINLAHQLIDVGFDLIIGHHPHVTQSVEKYKDKMIFYSLGNFIFDQNFSKRTQRGLAVQLQFGKKKEEYTIYNSRQKKYKIEELKQNKGQISGESPISTLYKYHLKILSLWMSLLMKLEFVSHFFELNTQVIPIFLNRFKKKIIKPSKIT